MTYIRTQKHNFSTPDKTYRTTLFINDTKERTRAFTDALSNPILFSQAFFHDTRQSNYTRIEIPRVRWSTHTGTNESDKKRSEIEDFYRPDHQHFLVSVRSYLRFTSIGTRERGRTPTPISIHKKQIISSLFNAI